MATIRLQALDALDAKIRALPGFDFLRFGIDTKRAPNSDEIRASAGLGIVMQRDQGQSPPGTQFIAKDRHQARVTFELFAKNSTSGAADIDAMYNAIHAAIRLDEQLGGLVSFVTELGFEAVGYPEGAGEEFLPSSELEYELDLFTAKGNPSSL